MRVGNRDANVGVTDVLEREDLANMSMTATPTCGGGPNVALDIKTAAALWPEKIRMTNRVPRARIAAGSSFVPASIDVALYVLPRANAPP